MKKIFALICALALLLTSFAFAEEDRLGGLTLPLVDKDTTVTLFYGSLYEHTDDTWLFQRIKERTGIQIHPLCFPKDIVSEKLATYIASAELPDLIVGGFGGNERNMYGEQGAFACVQDYLDITPNVKSIFFDDAENNQRYLLFSAESGRNYFYPVYKLNRDVNFGFMYRADVFKALDIEPWTDTESFLEALRTIKKAYPDSYPYGNKGGIASINRWSTYFDLNSLPCAYDYDTNQWFIACTTENFRKGLDVYKTMYNEGLLDPEFMTDTLDTWNAKQLNNQNFVMNDWIGRMALLEAEGRKTNPDFDLAYARPIGNGKMQELSKFDSWGVTVANNANTEASVKLVDYLYSTEGSEINTLGIEGDNFVWDENGKAVYPDIEGDVDITKVEEKYGMWIEGFYLHPSRKCFYYSYTPDEQYAQDLINNECGYSRLPPPQQFETDADADAFAQLNTELTDKMNTFAGNYIIDASYGDEQWNAWVESVNASYAEKMLAILNK